MINTRRKGNRVELKAVKELESIGYLVYRVKGSTKFNKNVDIFGLFDILAIQRNIEYTQVRLIQVKSNKKPSLKPFKQFKKLYPDFASAEVWVWKDSKGFDKYIGI